MSRLRSQAKWYRRRSTVPTGPRARPLRAGLVVGHPTGDPPTPRRASNRRDLRRNVNAASCAGQGEPRRPRWATTVMLASTLADERHRTDPPPPEDARGVDAAR